MWVESETGNGSVFFFTIPYRNVSIPVYPSKKLNIQNLKTFKILLVEDEEINIVLFSEIFKNIRIFNKLKISYIHAYSGNDAVEFCKNDKNIKLVLMDIKLPDTDGYEATRQIKKLRPNLPIIAQTAYALNGEKEKALLAGCDSYISKPIDIEKLTNLIKKYFLKQEHLETKTEPLRKPNVSFML